jgi:energy-coupling factor transporter ATP-binding protein EcfA2
MNTARTNDTNNNFRLIGILTGKRPSKEELLSGRKDYLKVLHEETYYPFYNCFTFNQKENILSYNKELDVNLYSIETENNLGTYLNINISALVGKNGSGKSTLLELIYLASYHIGVSAKVLENPENGNKINGIKTELGLNLELFYQSNNFIYRITLYPNQQLPHLEFKEFQNNPFVQFSSSNKPSDLTKIDRSHLEGLFYSIVVNYSVYGLNAKHIGKWINALFHKNDGYQTPLVINPMRTDGNIDINIEDFLASSRLLTNILSEDNPSRFKITESHTVKRLKFKLNQEKVKFITEVPLFVNGRKKGTRKMSFPEFYDLHGEALNPFEQMKDGEAWLFRSIYIILFNHTEDELSDNKWKKLYLNVDHASLVKKSLVSDKNRN